MFVRVAYQDADQTIICAFREDGSIRVIEPVDIDLWAAATGGVYGTVEAYVAPDESEETPE